MVTLFLCQSCRKRYFKSKKALNSHYRACLLCRRHKTKVMSINLYVEDIERLRKIKRLYHVTSADLFSVIMQDVPKSKRGSRQIKAKA